MDVDSYKKCYLPGKIGRCLHKNVQRFFGRNKKCYLLGKIGRCLHKNVQRFFVELKK
jgi:hypothetical protein